MGDHEHNGSDPQTKPQGMGEDLASRGDGAGKENWKDQHWLISGAAGSLGTALARRMASRGAILVLLDKNKRALDSLADDIEAAGGEPPFLFPLDLGGATPDDYHRFAEALHQHLGRLHGVLHCAGHFDGMTPLTQVSAVQWWVTLQANLSAPLLLSRELLPLMREQGGRLVFLLDDLERTAAAYWGAYGTAQWGLHNLTRQLASELSNLPVHVQGIVLPAFQSGLRAKAFPAESPAGLPTPEIIAERLCIFLHEQKNVPVIYDFQEEIIKNPA